MAAERRVTGPTGSPGRGGDGPLRSGRALRMLLGVQLALFAAQLVIGIVVNLYAAIPDAHPGSSSRGGAYFSNLGTVLWWALSAGPAILAVHVALGLALILLALALVPLGLGAGALRTTLVSLAAACTIGAAFNGGSFLIFGNHDNRSSLIMEILFTAAATCYVITLVASSRQLRPISPASLRRR